jgi:hypothetical protein
VFVTLLQIFNTIIGVLDKLKHIDGPPARFACALLNILVLLGYSGILNTIFLKRNLQRARIVYLFIAIAIQITILILAILSWTESILTYYVANAVIQGLTGILTAINLICTVFVVNEQHEDLKCR